jgi:hypothetical protein
MELIQQKPKFKEIKFNLKKAYLKDNIIYFSFMDKNFKVESELCEEVI